MKEQVWLVWFDCLTTDNAVKECVTWFHLTI